MGKRDGTVSVLYIIRKSVRGARTLHFILMGLIGLLVSGRWTMQNILLPASLLSLSLSFVWLYTTMINDAFDIEIDRKAHPDRPLVRSEITFRRYSNIYNAILMLSLLFSLFLGVIPLLSVFGFAVLAYLYSAPPFRVRDRPYATIIIGLASSFSLLAGYSAIFWPLSGTFFYFPSWSPAFFTLFLIILFALSVSPLINAYHDRDGDAAAGVKNIYTILGPEKGKIVVSLLIPLLFALPLILYHSLADVIVSLSFGLFVAFIFFRQGSAIPVFVSYFMVLLYFLSRFLGVI